MQTFSTGKQVIGLLVFIAITALAAALGAWGSANAPTFYQALTLPSWAPPAWLFGPVWTLLYLLMAVAAWLVWRAQHPSTQSALVLYFAQLVFNALWSWCFFGWQQGGLALAVIAVLWVLLVLTIRAFWRIKPLAGALLLPYIAWVSFAAVLNAVVWQLNPTLL